MQNHVAQDLIKFINRAPTPYTAVSELKKRLCNAGGKEVRLSDITNKLTDGCLYYTVFGDSCIGAFIKGNTLEYGIKLAAAHIDFPVLHIKPNPTQSSSGNIERINVEFYGGSIHHTWLDRPLKIAGRVSILTQGSDDIKTVDIDSGDITFIIPSAAIHMVRDVNEGARFSVQNELLPFFGSVNDATDSNFLEYLATKCGEALGAKVSPSEILSFDLSMLDAQPAAFSGAENEFISAPGIDDKAMTHAIFTALCNAYSLEKNEAASGKLIAPSIALAFNHEECGSLSATGARSSFTNAFIKAVCAATSSNTDDAAILETMEKSLALSSDMAHAQHPSYLGKTDTQNAVYLGKGPVLKTSANQSYATSVTASSKFIALCKKADIPYQQFANNSDSRGGSTIGPMLAASLGITTADIGSAMLSMHSARELCSSKDQEYTQKLFETFFRGI